jgi:periplasmic divalent cation tolerance protein
MGPEDSAVVVQTTAGSYEEASLLASSLVGRRLAACVQIVPGVESVYWWQGEVARGPEWLLLCKTTAAKYEELERAILELHSYTTPEVIALPVGRGSAAYLAWLRAEVAPGGGR